MATKRTTVEEATDAALFRMGASEGGHARANKLSAEERSEIARRAAEARWADSPIRRATYTGSLMIGEVELECAVLDDGTRVLSQGTVAAALGRSRSSGPKRGGIPFISANNVMELVSPQLNELLEPITYRIPDQRFTAKGYRAESLPGVCDVYLEARRLGVLQENQIPTAEAAEVLIRSLAKVGIIALVDEATGYQEQRARDELQRLLEAYVQEDFRPWVAIFPPHFFSEIYRLYGWDYKPGNSKRPGYVGTIINEYIYEQLPEGVLEELRRVNPKTGSGWRARRHHQHLTADTGNQALDRQIQTVITLMQVSNTLDEFRTLFARKFPPQGAPHGRKVLRVTVDEHGQAMTLFDYLAEETPAAHAVMAPAPTV